MTYRRDFSDYGDTEEQGGELLRRSGTDEFRSEDTPLPPRVAAGWNDDFFEDEDSFFENAPPPPPPIHPSHHLRQVQPQQRIGFGQHRQRYPQRQPPPPFPLQLLQPHPSSGIPPLQSRIHQRQQGIIVPPQGQQATYHSAVPPPHLPTPATPLPIQPIQPIQPISHRVLRAPPFEEDFADVRLFDDDDAIPLDDPGSGPDDGVMVIPMGQRVPASRLPPVQPRHGEQQRAGLIPLRIPLNGNEPLSFPDCFDALPVNDLARRAYCLQQQFNLFLDQCPHTYDHFVPLVVRGSCCAIKTPGFCLPFPLDHSIWGMGERLREQVCVDGVGVGDVERLVAVFPSGYCEFVPWEERERIPVGKGFSFFDGRTDQIPIGDLFCLRIAVPLIYRRVNSRDSFCGYRTNVFSNRFRFVTHATAHERMAQLYDLGAWISQIRKFGWHYFSTQGRKSGVQNYFRHPDVAVLEGHKRRNKCQHHIYTISGVNLSYGSSPGAVKLTFEVLCGDANVAISPVNTRLSFYFCPGGKNYDHFACPGQPVMCTKVFPVHQVGRTSCVTACLNLSGSQRGIIVIRLHPFASGFVVEGKVDYVPQLLAGGSSEVGSDSPSEGPPDDGDGGGNDESGDGGGSVATCELRETENFPTAVYFGDSASLDFRARFFGSEFFQGFVRSVLVSRSPNFGSFGGQDIRNAVQKFHQDQFGFTLLIHAAARGLASLVEILIEIGCDAAQKDNFGCTAKDWAEVFRWDRVLEVLTRKDTVPLSFPREAEVENAIADSDEFPDAQEEEGILDSDVPSTTETVTIADDVTPEEDDETGDDDLHVSPRGGVTEENEARESFVGVRNDDRQLNERLAAESEREDAETPGMEIPIQPPRRRIGFCAGVGVGFLVVSAVGFVLALVLNR